MNTLLDPGSRRSDEPDRRRELLTEAGAAALSIAAALVVLPVIAVDEVVRALWPLRGERRVHRNEETPLGMYYD